ncbi:hypothetical protein [Salinivibrio costicola]|uniref:hypothetical protein n=1 Tax=Salinivibrio costicola TaxID=51367 RepID=UPI0003956CCF|nr:hypothetical protein [Salinivibrio costicola]
MHNDEKRIASTLFKSPLSASQFSDVPRQVANRKQFMLYDSDDEIIERLRVLVAPSASRSEVIRVALSALSDLPDSAIIEKLNRIKE